MGNRISNFYWMKIDDKFNIFSLTNKKVFLIITDILI